MNVGAFMYNGSEDTQELQEALTGEEEVGRADRSSMAQATSRQQLKERGSLLSILCPKRIFLWLTRVVQKLAQALLMAQVWEKRAQARLTLLLSVQKLLRWSMSKRFRVSLAWAGGDEGNKRKGLPANHPPTAAQWRSPWAKAAAGLLKEALGHWEKNHWAKPVLTQRPKQLLQRRPQALGTLVS